MAAILVIAPTAAPSGANADSAFVDFGCARPLRVAGFEYGPWSHDGGGITPDLLHVLSERTGCRFEMVPIARAEAWSALRAGNIDIIPNSIQTEERLDVAHFAPIIRTPNIVIARTRIAQSLGSFDALVANGPELVGAIDGFLYGSFFDYRIELLRGHDRLVAADDPRQLVDALRKGEVGAILLPVWHYFHYVADMERQSLFRILDTSRAAPLASGLAFAREVFSAAQSDNWLRAIESIYLDGTFDRLVERHQYRRRAAPSPVR